VLLRKDSLQLQRLDPHKKLQKPLPPDTSFPWLEISPKCVFGRSSTPDLTGGA